MGKVSTICNYLLTFAIAIAVREPSLPNFPPPIGLSILEYEQGVVDATPSPVPPIVSPVRPAKKAECTCQVSSESAS